MANTERNLIIGGIVLVVIVVITLVLLYFTGVIGKSSKPKPSNSSVSQSNSSVSQSNNPNIFIHDMGDMTEEQKQDKTIKKPLEIVNFVFNDEPDPNTLNT